jgi:hypothetical protein
LENPPEEGGLRFWTLYQGPSKKQEERWEKRKEKKKKTLQMLIMKVL